MAVPPTKLRGRVVRTTYLYEDPTHPLRPTQTITSPEWTEEDRALLLGLADYEATLCPGCGQPQHLAWHNHTDGEWEGMRFVCHACTAKDDHQVIYGVPTLFMNPERVTLLPPFNLEKTTTPPEKQPAGGES